MLSREDARIEKHIRWAEERLRARDASHLPLAVRHVRDRLIEALAEYRRAGRFPRNHVRGALTPVFIDEHGTRCAMAHLLELVGAHSLVARVASTNNLASIHELASDPELLMWLAAMGLTIDEAASIQPSYGWYKQAHLADTAAPASPDAAPEIVGATEPLPGRSCAFGHATDALVPLTLVFGAAVLAQRRWLH